MPMLRRSEERRVGKECRSRWSKGAWIAAVSSAGPTQRKFSASSVILWVFLINSGKAQPPATTAQPQSSDPELERLVSQLQRAHLALNDWPNMGRYRDANAKTVPPAPGENRVVFMGDSITDGWGKGQAPFFPGKPYINRGISGQTTPQMLVRFRPDVIELKPKVVVTLAGTNDLAGNTGTETLQNIEDNLASMSELAKANGIRVVLASVMPICDSLRPQSARRPPQQIVALNDWIKTYSAKNNFV